MNGNNKAQVRAVDCGGNSWEFRCSTRRRGPYNKPVFRLENGIRLFAMLVSELGTGSSSKRMTRLSSGKYATG